MKLLAGKFDNCKRFCRLFVDDQNVMIVNAGNREEIVFDEQIIDDLLSIGGVNVIKSQSLQERAIKAFDVFCNIKKWEKWIVEKVLIE